MPQIAGYNPWSEGIIKYLELSTQAGLLFYIDGGWDAVLSSAIADTFGSYVLILGVSPHDELIIEAMVLVPSALGLGASGEIYVSEGSVGSEVVKKQGFFMGTGITHVERIPIWHHITLGARVSVKIRDSEAIANTYYVGFHGARLK